MKLIVAIIFFVILSVTFVGYELYLRAHPGLYAYRLDDNQGKVYGCSQDYPCKIGSYCASITFGKNLPGMATECRLVIDMFSKSRSK